MTSPFDRPIPGQSLTDEPRNNPWENPAEIPLEIIFDLGYSYTQIKDPKKGLSFESKGNLNSQKYRYLQTMLLCVENIRFRSLCSGKQW